MRSSSRVRRAVRGDLCVALSQHRAVQGAEVDGGEEGARTALTRRGTSRTSHRGILDESIQSPVSGYARATLRIMLPDAST